MNTPAQTCDITARYVPGYGWLPLAYVDFKEFYRGSYKKSMVEAVDAAKEMLLKEYPQFKAAFPA